MIHRLSIAIALAAGAAGAVAWSPVAQSQLAPTRGEVCFAEHCTRCHPASRALAVSKGTQGWTRTVERMSARHHRAFGYALLGEDQRAVVAHLAAKAGAAQGW